MMTLQMMRELAKAYCNVVNNNVTIHNDYSNKLNKDYSNIEDLINRKYKKLSDKIEDNSIDLQDGFNDKIGDLKGKVLDISDNVDKLLTKAEKFENGSIPIKLNMLSQSGKPFVNLSSDDSDDAEEDGEKNNDFSSLSAIDDGNTEEVDSDDENEQNSDEEDDLGSKLATKADMQKLADYIKEETEKSRPTIPKEVAITAGIIAIGIILKKYAMVLGGRNDVFR